MKTILTTIMIMIGIMALSAQQDSTQFIDIGPDYSPKPETFIQDGFHHGGLFAADMHYGQVEGENAIFFGFKGAYVMNRSLEIGLAGYTVYSELQHPNFDNGNVNILGGYGGLHLAPVILPMKKVHFSIPIMLGAGAIGYDEDFFDNSSGEFHFADDWDEIFVAQAGVNVVFNITNFFQIEAGVRYLQTTDIELDLIDDLDISGLTGGFGLRFGWF